MCMYLCVCCVCVCVCKSLCARKTEKTHLKISMHEPQANPHSAHQTHICHDITHSRMRILTRTSQHARGASGPRYSCRPFSFLNMMRRSLSDGEGAWQSASLTQEANHASMVASRAPQRKCSHVAYFITLEPKRGRART